MKGKLTIAEKYYIDNHINELSEKEIAEHLDRGVPTIKRYIENNVIKETPKKKTKKKDTTFNKLMAHKTRNDVKVVTVMTKAASEYADATRQTNKTNKKLQKAIHKPRG